MIINGDKAIVCKLIIWKCGNGYVLFNYVASDSVSFCGTLEKCVWECENGYVIEKFCFSTIWLQVQFHPVVPLASVFGLVGGVEGQPKSCE